jgi:hypothetical protein
MFAKQMLDLAQVPRPNDGSVRYTNYFYHAGMVKVLNLLLGDKLKGVISRTINTDIPIR